MEKCKVCNKEYDLLELHIRAHNLTKKEYFDKFLKVDGTDKCLFCGKSPTKFTTLKYGYSKFCSVKCSKQHQLNSPIKINKMLEKKKFTSLKKYGVEHQ